MGFDRCIIFDMDGVLVNSEPLHFEFENMLFKSLGITISREQHETFVGTTSKTMWEIIKKTYKLQFTVPELILKGQSEFLTYLKSQKSLSLIPGIKELLDRLTDAEYTLALASSSPNQLINYILNETNIYKYFKVITSGDDVSHGKPNPEIFLKTSESVKIVPENCMVIEDSANGITAAIKAGMNCVGYSNQGSGNQDLRTADLVINSFDKLKLAAIDLLFTGF